MGPGELDAVALVMSLLAVVMAASAALWVSEDRARCRAPRPPRSDDLDSVE